MTERKTVLVVVGPTASGKTALAVEACLAFGGEVVSADSMQIYRGMDIGTAKPDLEERRGVSHHLMDIVDPDMPFSVADWQQAARRTIDDLHARNRLAVVAGGTGLYVNSLVQNLSFSEVAGDPAYRERLHDMAREAGVEAVHALLARKDPESAARIHPNNLVRVVRTLEVVEATGETMAVHHMRSKAAPSPWRFVILGLLPERHLLYERINRRVDVMLGQGLEAEVHRLLDAGYAPTLTSMQGIGYKELAAHFRGECPREAAVEAIRQGSRNYAKRQITWFSRLEGLSWHDPQRLGMEGLLQLARQRLSSADDVTNG